MLDPTQITELLHRARAGDRGALDRLLPLVYEELHAIARRQGPVADTLNTTAVVHEAYLRLVDAGVPWQDRGHFFAVATIAMRQILVDYARRARAARRGGDRVRVELREGDSVRPAGFDEVLAVHESLERLARLSERSARVVEARYFGGLSVEETAEALGVTERTVLRDWRKARAFLYTDLAGDAGAGPA